MRKIIEYTLISVDGVSEDPQAMGVMSYRDDAYLRDGLGVLLASEAMLMGRKTYGSFSRAWLWKSSPVGGSNKRHPKVRIFKTTERGPLGQRRAGGR